MGWLKRIIRNPVAAVILLIALIASLRSLPAGIYDWTIVGMARAGRMDWSTGKLDIRPMSGINAFVLREPAAATPDGPVPLRLIDPGSESWDELSKLTTQRPRDLVEFTIRSGEFQTGLYAPTQFVKYHEVEVKELGTPSAFTPEELARARGVFIDWTSTLGRAHDQYAREKDYRTSTPLWRGYLHNALALLALLAFIYSVWWNLLPSTWRERARGRRLARGLCPRCAYSVRGLTADRCPECGEAVPDLASSVLSTHK